MGSQIFRNNFFNQNYQMKIHSSGFPNVLLGKKNKLPYGYNNNKNPIQDNFVYLTDWSFITNMLVS